MAAIRELTWIGRRSAIALLVMFAWSTGALAQDELRPPSNVEAVDRPNDVGDGIIVSWELSPDDDSEFDPPRVAQYDIYRRGAREADDAFAKIGEVPLGTGEFVDEPNPKEGHEVVRDTAYLYRVIAIGPNGEQSPVADLPAPVVATLQWFNRSRGWLLAIVLLVCGSVAIFIAIAKSGRELYLRRIPGLEAVDEAVGRATEMGRPCFFIAGSQDINDIQTVAGITVLGRVATLVAEYDASLEVPTSRSLVMATARETVEASYYAAGRPDAYNEDDIYYLTDEQFGFVAGVMGAIVRKKPATCFYMGTFYAESLLLAETGNSVGAIQVAGTAMPAQLPFFVAACDYTLIGEEFFAASAYLSGEPLQLGSLRGQDIGKIFVGVVVVVGCAAATLGAVSDAAVFDAVADFLRDNLLGKGGFWPS